MLFCSYKGEISLCFALSIVRSQVYLKWHKGESEIKVRRFYCAKLSKCFKASKTCFLKMCYSLPMQAAMAVPQCNSMTLFQACWNNTDWRFGWVIMQEHFQMECEKQASPKAFWISLHSHIFRKQIWPVGNSKHDWVFQDSFWDLMKITGSEPLFMHFLMVQWQ